VTPLQFGVIAQRPFLLFSLNVDGFLQCDLVGSVLGELRGAIRLDLAVLRLQLGQFAKQGVLARLERAVSGFQVGKVVDQGGDGLDLFCRVGGLARIKGRNALPEALGLPFNHAQLLTEGPHLGVGLVFQQGHFVGDLAQRLIMRL